VTQSPRSASETVSAIRAAGLIPVIRADSSAVAIHVVNALVDAGLTIVEITMTVPDAMAAIEAIAGRFGQRIVLGAGTVTHAATAQSALEAGAEFLVSPCLVPDVLAVARQAGVAAIPGALTPTELHDAIAAGADLVKIFPVQNIGGPAYLRALRGPFPHAPLVPTGGVALADIGEYFRAGAVAVGVGSELTPKSMIARGDYDGVRQLAEQFVRAVETARQP